MLKSTLFLVFSPFFFAITACAQPYDFNELKDHCSAHYPDESLVVYNSKETYSFSTSGKSDSPIVGKLQSDNLIVNIFDNNEIVFPAYTNSFSLIRGLSTAKYYEDRERFRPVTRFFEINHYESNGIFHSDFYVNKLGTTEEDAGIYKLEYTKLYEDYKFLASISLIDELPTINKVVSLEIPSWLEVEILEMNFEGFNITKEVDTKSKKGTRYIYTWKNIPKFEKMDYSPSSRYYLPHLVLVYKHFSRRGEKTELMPDVSELYAWYHKLAQEVDDQPDLIQPLVEQFKDLPKGKAQIDSVNAWIRDNIRYIAFESGIAGFKPENCQTVYKNRYGDCKGMANLCKNVLEILGYDARLAWIGTRKEVPYDYEIPSLIVDNHMITAVKIDSSFVFIDPTETYGRSAEYAYRIQGRPVLIENNDSFVVTKVPKSNIDADRVNRKYKVSFDPKINTITYAANATYRGEPKKYILAGFNYTFANDRLTALTNFLRTSETGSFELKETSGLHKADDQITIAYSFSTKEGAIDLGNEYYIDIDPSYDFEYAEVKANRKAPWYFNERYNRVTEIEFVVPKGYKTDHVPKPFSIENEEFHVEIATKVEGDTLRLNKTIQIFSGTISAEFQPQWEQCLKRLKKYYDDRIIISKK